MPEGLYISAAYQAGSGVAPGADPHAPRDGSVTATSSRGQSTHPAPRSTAAHIHSRLRRLKSINCEALAASVIIHEEGHTPI